MAIAFAFVVLAAGASLVYIGWKGLSFTAFWEQVQGKGGGTA